MQAVYNSDYIPLSKIGGWVSTKNRKSKISKSLYHLHHATISPTALHKSSSIPTTTALCQPFLTLPNLHQLLNTTSFFFTLLIFLNSFLTIYRPLYLSHKQYLMSSFLTNPHTHKTHHFSAIFPILAPLGFTQIHFSSPQTYPNLNFLCALF